MPADYITFSTNSNALDTGYIGPDFFYANWQWIFFLDTFILSGG